MEEWLLVLVAEVEVVGRAGLVGSGGGEDDVVVGRGGAVNLLVLHGIYGIIPNSTSLYYPSNNSTALDQPTRSTHFPLLCQSIPPPSSTITLFFHAVES